MMDEMSIYERFGRAIEREQQNAEALTAQIAKTKEVAELIGRSWGIAKNILKAAVEEGTIETKKVGRSIYWRLK